MHPTRGLLMPSDFLSVAEETGVIVPIGAWTFQEACQQLSEWQENFPTDPPLSVSVNLSERQIKLPELVKHVAEALRVNDLPASSLALELTERLLTDEAEEPTRILHQLIGLGVKLHIDDFGTGYSSLSILHRIPVSALKIDRSFVNSSGIENGRDEILKSIILLARGLSVDTIAEGVELEDEEVRLRAMGCEYAQGYLFSKPLPSEEAAAFLTSMARSSGEGFVVSVPPS